MSHLSEVQSWMKWFGWTNYGNPGSVKVDINGAWIARHGDATWIADVDDAYERVQREKVDADIKRRENELRWL